MFSMCHSAIPRHTVVKVLVYVTGISLGELHVMCVDSKVCVVFHVLNEIHLVYGE